MRAMPLMVCSVFKLQSAYVVGNAKAAPLGPLRALRGYARPQPRPQPREARGKIALSSGDPRVMPNICLRIPSIKSDQVRAFARATRLAEQTSKKCSTKLVRKTVCKLREA